MLQSFPWFGDSIFCQKPIVIVEDHSFHISELLGSLQETAPNLLPEITIVCLDKPGPDTDQAAGQWLEQYPETQIASNAGPELRPERPFLHQQLPESLSHQSSVYCQWIANLLRPGGILLQDIQLSTLSFLATDRWWDSTFLASTVRGILSETPPKCLFVSNKRGFSATFGAELLAAGHDPRDVLDKDLLVDHVITSLQKHFRQQFPYTLHWSAHTDSFGSAAFLDSPTQEQRGFSDFDFLLLKQEDNRTKIGGRFLKKELILADSSPECVTWTELVQDRLQGDDGIEVTSIGNRLLGGTALKAEATNSASRHIHSLRKRLTNASHLLTDSGKYLLPTNCNVGLVEPSTSPNN